MLPASMLAVGLKKPGGADQLFIEEVELPRPVAGEVLIEVHACGVSRPDVLQRLGLYPPPDGANKRLGLEVSGVVVGLGDGVDPSLLGKVVMALCNGGGYAQYACVPAGQCMAVPKQLSFIEAASLPETYMTVWQNLFVKGGLASGQHVLIHGGSSGIGSAAIQLCVAHGAVVHVTVGSVCKADYCRDLGASFVYNYREQDWAGLAFQNSGGIHLVLDMVAGPYLDLDLFCLAPEGKILVIALLGGRKCEIDASRLLMKQAVLTGTTLRSRDARFKALLAGQVEAELARRFESGEVKATVSAVFEFNEVQKAHELMESGNLTGKIVLQVKNQKGSERV